MIHDEGSLLRGTQNIRPAVLEDVDALVELMGSTFRETYASRMNPDEVDAYVAAHFTHAAIAALLADSASTLLVSEVGVRLLGYLLLRRAMAPPGVASQAPIELARIYLRQEAIGRGLGAALMMAANNEARRLQCDTLWLLVHENNRHVRGFYRRWGFVEVGSAPFRFEGRDYVDPAMAAEVIP